MPDANTAEREEYVKQLKRKMESWREVILPMNSILLWEESWHPGLIFGITNIVFFFIWLLEPAILSIIALFLLVLALADYSVPTLVAKYYTSKWTGQKEKKLHEICQTIYNTMQSIKNAWNYFQQIKYTRPNIYYAVTITCLVLFAWIGNTVNNLLIIYIIVNGLLLLPGLKHKGQLMSKFLNNHMSHSKSE